MSKKDKKKKKKEVRRQQELQAQSRHPPVTLHLKYDAAQTTAENARHWAMADNLSADGSLTPEIRRTLRNRSRCGKRDAQHYEHLEGEKQIL